MRTFLLLTILGVSLYAGNGESQACSENTLKGSYGYTISGTRPLRGGPAGSTEQVNGAGVRQYDGRGGFTQVDTTKGAMVAAAVDVATSGTYTVNPDCSGTAILIVPDLPVPVEARFVVVNKGKEIFWMVLNPAPVMVLGHAVRQ